MNKAYIFYAHVFSLVTLPC